MLITRITPFLLLITAFCTFNLKAQDTTFELKTVVIDAGHGGKDPGASVGQVKEKDIALAVALKTGSLIKEMYPDINVIYTRDKDIFVPLDQRAEIANKQKADLFISIHVNYFRAENTLGAETYILGNHRSEENLKVAQMENSVILLEDDYSTRYEGFDPNSSESYIMFELIQNEFLEQSRFFADHLQKSFISDAHRKSRGVRQAGFLVLRRTTMPSVLVELGFISNNKEQSFLVSDAGRQKMAQSIAEAFSNYKTRVDSRSSITITEPAIIPSQKIEKHDTIIQIQTVTAYGKYYAVQILASKIPLNIDNPVFNSESPVYSFFEKGWHKYYIGLTQDYNTAIQNQAKISGHYNGAFLVVFNKGIKELFIKQK